MLDALYTIYAIIVSAIAPSYALDNFLFTGDSTCTHGRHPLDHCQDCDDECGYENDDDTEDVWCIAVVELTEQELQNLIDAQRAEIECDWEIERSGGLHV